MVSIYMNSGINISKSQVKFDSVPIQKIVDKFQTPVMIFSEKRLIDNYALFEKSFQKYYPNTNVYYSIKTNFEIQILRTLKNLGSNAEAASALEVMIAQKAGFKPSQIILDGPYWTDEDIRFCIKKGVKTFNIDSLDLLRRLNNIATKLNQKVKVSFRIFPGIKMSILKSFIEGYISKYGIPQTEAISAYKYCQKMKNILPVAISSHIGSMITDPKYYENSIDRLLHLAAQLKSQLNISIEEINIGGGFGIQSLNYYSLQNIVLEKAGISKYSKAAPIEEFAQKIGTSFKRKLAYYKLPNLKLILEPGRFIVSDTGILITRVVAAKDKWIFIDGGINLIPESIFFIRRGFMVANKIKTPANYQYNIAGPTLNTADVLAENQKMPKMAAGDIVIVLDAGAYTLTRSNQFTILRPAVLYITKDGQIKFLRKKENPQDVLNKMIID